MASRIVKERSNGKLSIDPGDFVVGIIQWIDEYFEKKNIFISNKGWTSLYIGLMILLVSCSFTGKIITNPFTYYTYAIAYGLILYFCLEFGRKIYKSKYDLEQMKKATITHNKIGLIIEKQSTINPEGVIEEIKKLIKEGNFEENIQFSLLRKYNDYPLNLKKFVDMIALEGKFSNKTLNYLLSVGEFSEDFLEKLFQECGKVESLIFNVGRLQYYNFEDNSVEKNYFLAGYQYKQENYKLWIGYLIAFSTLLLIFSIGITLVDVYGHDFTNEGSVLIYILFLVVGMLVYVKLVIITKIKLINKILKKRDIELTGPKFDKFIDELNI